MSRELKDKRIPIMMTAAEVDAVDTWRFTNRIATRSEAMRLLIGEALGHEGLIAFAKECFKAAWEGGELDGCDLQEMGVKHGLLELVPFDPAIHSDSTDYAEEGDDWYTFAGPLRSEP